MNLEELETIVIDDDDDDENKEFQFLKAVKGSKDVSPPLEIIDDDDELDESRNTKHSIAEMITKVLVTLPEERGTEEKICQLVAENFPNVCGNWKELVISCLTKKKRFFNLVGHTIDGAIWSFSSSFKDFLHLKWVSDCKQEESYEEARVTSIPCPVIVCSKMVTVVKEQDVKCYKKDSSNNVNPEFGYDDQLIDPLIEGNNTGFGNSEANDLNEKHPLELLASNENSSVKKIKLSKDIFSDFAQIFVDSDESFFRMKFFSEMGERDRVRPSIAQCRLHCTVCDVHVGCGGGRARIHTSLAVVVCPGCRDLTDADPQTFVAACQWCFKIDGVYFLCSTCPAKCCEVRPKNSKKLNER